MTAGSRPVRAVVLGLAVALGACAAGEEEEPPEEPTQADGVFGQAPPAVGGIPSVVLLTTSEPVEVAWPELPTIDQLGLQFSPRLLLVPVGQPMRFTNSETLQHNVSVRRAADRTSLLNVDTPPGGEVTFTPDAEGGYDVTCETHPGMTAFVFATHAPYASFADETGTFHIPDVAPGSYRLRVWSVDPERRSERPVVVAAGHATEVTAGPSG